MVQSRRARHAGPHLRHVPCLMCHADPCARSCAPRHREFCASELCRSACKKATAAVHHSQLCRYLWHAGIFDGHRGAQAAEFAAQHFQEHLEINWQAPSACVALQAAFLSLDASFEHSQVCCPTLAEPCKRKSQGCGMKDPAAAQHGARCVRYPRASCWQDASASVGLAPRRLSRPAGQNDAPSSREVVQALHLAFQNKAAIFCRTTLGRIERAGWAAQQGNAPGQAPRPLLCWCMLDVCMLPMQATAGQSSAET